MPYWSAGLYAQLRTRDEALTAAAAEMARVNAQLRSRRRRAPRGQSDVQRHAGSAHPLPLCRASHVHRPEVAPWGCSCCQDGALSQQTDSGHRNTGSERLPAPRRQLFDAITKSTVDSLQPDGLDSVHITHCQRQATDLQGMATAWLPPLPRTAPRRASAIKEQLPLLRLFDTEHADCRSVSEDGSWARA